MYDNSCIFQSTPPVKAATAVIYNLYKTFRISIHAAREGGDDVTFFFPISVDISIHAAREGGDSSAGVPTTAT